MKTKRHDPDVRETIVRAALPHVVFDGWTLAALRLGARDAGLSAARADTTFPDGAVEAIAYLAAVADRDMVRALSAREDWAALKVREKIYWAVRTRLEQWPDEREALRRAAAVLALPLNAPVALRITAATVDAMWRACGDAATDYNWYTKRASLAAVYAATVLYWLDDDSEGFADTWDFLKRRIDDALRLPKAGGKLVKKLTDGLGHLPNPLRAKSPFRA